VGERTWPLDQELRVSSDTEDGELAAECACALGLGSPCQDCAGHDAFMNLAGVLLADFDLRDLVQVLAERCGRLGRAAEVGLFLAGSEGELQVVASTLRRKHKLELLEVQHHTDGPCVEVLRSGQAVLNASIAGNTPWPNFAAEARAGGYQIVHALPMRHNGQVIGVVNIFDDRPVTLNPTRARVAQALIDIAAFAIVQGRALHEATSVTRQLQGALESRVVIEQAKGVVSHRLGIDIGQAFHLLREYSRQTNTRLTQVASNVVERRLGTEEVLAMAGANRRARTSRSDRANSSRALGPAS
jgi:ANTAR domain/GAF domain